jgi:hypothetical protein
MEELNGYCTHLLDGGPTKGQARTAQNTPDIDELDSLRVEFLSPPGRLTNRHPGHLAKLETVPWADVAALEPL